MMSVLYNTLRHCLLFPVCLFPVCLCLMQCVAERYGVRVCVCVSLEEGSEVECGAVGCSGVSGVNESCVAVGCSGLQCLAVSCSVVSRVNESCSDATYE